MKAEIISVGNEVVSGYVVNTNASYIAKELSKLGIETLSHRTIKDDEDTIIEVLNESIKKYEYVIVSGGLGPTKDDLTKETVCKLLHKELIIDKSILSHIEKHFRTINEEMPTTNIKQSMFPQDSYILKNRYGTAPGCILTSGGCKIILLPGPPNELKLMLDKEVMPYIRENIKNQVYLETVDVKVFGIAESLVAETLENKFGEKIWNNVATYVGDNEIIIRATKMSHSVEEARGYIRQFKKQIKECFENNIIGYNDEVIEEKVVKLLIEQGKKVATVESCTGGMLAEVLINCGGVSACFNEGIVTYSNDAKIKYVNVLPETLDKMGAVSLETAIQMAQGIRERSGADIGLSTTGIAGPGGGTKEKPVGLVYSAISTKEKTLVYRFNLSGSRRQIRERTVKNVLFNLLKILE